jgi:hypothetical protein
MQFIFSRFLEVIVFGTDRWGRPIVIQRVSTSMKRKYPQHTTLQVRVLFLSPLPRAYRTPLQASLPHSHTSFNLRSTLSFIHPSFLTPISFFLTTSPTIPNHLQERIAIQSSSQEALRVLCHMSSSQRGYNLEESIYIMDLQGVNQLSLLNHLSSAASKEESG